LTTEEGRLREVLPPSAVFLERRGGKVKGGGFFSLNLPYAVVKKNAATSIAF
jgi:hypothetical protein